MKKVLVAVGMIALLSAGCAQQAEPTTQPTTQAATEATNPGLYVEGSEVEDATKGVVRMYSLEGKSYDVLTAIGDKVLLISQDEKSELMILSGIDGVPTGKAVVPNSMIENGGFRATYNGFVYFNPKENAAVYLDPQLKEISTVPLPDDIEGTPIFSSDGQNVYYCAGQEIRGFDTDKRISRIIKSHNCAEQTLLGGYFEGAIVSCHVVDKNGNNALIWVSTETGQTLSADNLIENLWTYEDNFFVTRKDGTVQQRIFGKRGGVLREMTVKDGNMVSALELDGALYWTQSKKGELKLSIYNLSSGKKSAAISIHTTDRPKQFLADRWSQCVWILMTDEDTGEDYLLRWDVRKSNVKGGTDCTSQLYTKENPDEEGLKACQERVDQLNRQHGLRIRIWENAAKYPEGITMEAEYQVYAINRALDDLEKVLNQFPENFLYKSVKDAVRICIVRSIDGEVKAGQYWFDGDPFVVLSVGVDIEEEILKNIGYVIDSHVLGNSPQYDYWHKTNPKGFAYGDESTYSEKYLKGKTRAFVDERSMESSTEDRARIFWEAMKKDNKELFQSKTMQKKLKEICLGIRDAWRWERKTETFPWEQYLNKPIAYVKK